MARVQCETARSVFEQVLRDSPTGELRAGEIIAEIERLGLYRMRDGRLPESQQIHLGQVKQL